MEQEFFQLELHKNFAQIFRFHPVVQHSNFIEYIIEDVGGSSISTVTGYRSL